MKVVKQQSREQQVAIVVEKEEKVSCCIYMTSAVEGNLSCAQRLIEAVLLLRFNIPFTSTGSNSINSSH
jgi:hypothetical protein